MDNAELFSPYLGAAWVLEAFSGVGHLSRAFRELGWATVEHDLLHGVDILHGSYVSKVKSRLLASPRCKCVHLGTECTSFSRANTTGAVRSSDHPQGLPGLIGDRLVKCQVGNALLRVSMELFSFCVTHHVAVSLENPDTSILWLHPLVAPWVLEALGGSPRKRVHVVRTCYCAFGRPFRKNTKILTTVPGLAVLNRKCKHKGKHRMTLAGWDPETGEAVTKKGNAYPMKLARLWADVVRDGR